MIAALPMYARPVNRSAHDALWQLIRDNLRESGIAAPDALDHEIDHLEILARDDLVLAQICNLPYRKVFRDRVTLIGASDYGFEGCPEGHYRSHFVVHRDNPATEPMNLQNARFICNDTLSQSGYGAPQLWAQARGGAFRNVTTSGGHFASIKAIASGDADVAAIDAQSWRLAVAEAAHTDAVKIIGHTDTSPGQSFVTRKDQDPAPYLAAIKAAIADLSAVHATTLGLRDIIKLPSSAYNLPIPQAPAPIEA